jgi:hypothetical protein
MLHIPQVTGWLQAPTPTSFIVSQQQTHIASCFLAAESERDLAKSGKGARTAELDNKVRGNKVINIMERSIVHVCAK